MPAATAKNPSFHSLNLIGILQLNVDEERQVDFHLP
jgi:hypothetical protein